MVKNLPAIQETLFFFFFFFFNGHELEQTPGDGAVHGGHKESDTT